MRALLFVLVAAFCSSSLPFHANARDLGQWENVDPVVRSWYRNLRQPDNPGMSCCDTSDAYYVELKVRDGQAVAVIADDRPDELLGRPHIPVGTEFIVPNHKLKHDAGNPTGRDILFVGTSGQVFCLVQGSGI
jgi:hypothetical protein